MEREVSSAGRATRGDNVVRGSQCADHETDARGRVHRPRNQSPRNTRGTRAQLRRSPLGLPRPATAFSRGLCGQHGLSQRSRVQAWGMCARLRGSGIRASDATEKTAPLRGDLF